MQMTSFNHFILIILSMCVAYIPRFIPLRIFSIRKIPEWFNEWMKYVPVSLFTALVVKDVFMDTTNYTFVGLDHIAKILASLIVIVVAYRSRSMGLSVVIGLVAVAILSMFVIL